MKKSPANWNPCLLDQSTWAGARQPVSDCACVAGLWRSAGDFLPWSISTCPAASSSPRWGCRSWCRPVLRSTTSTSITATTSTVTRGKPLFFFSSPQTVQCSPSSLIYPSVHQSPSKMALFLHRLHQAHPKLFTFRPGHLGDGLPYINKSPT